MAPYGYATAGGSASRPLLVVLSPDPHVATSTYCYYLQKRAILALTHLVLSKYCFASFTDFIFYHNSAFLVGQDAKHIFPRRRLT